MTSKILNFRTFLLVLAMTAAIGMSAQVKVTGTVTDQTGEPLIGATVREKGSNGAGASTDFDGNYTIEVSNANATLQFAYFGMENLDVALNGRTTLDVTLK